MLMFVFNISKQAEINYKIVSNPNLYSACQHTLKEKHHTDTK